MKIEELIKGRGDNEQVNIDGVQVHVHVLKRMIQDGYTDILHYKENNTFTLWGKNCSACFTPEQLYERAKA